MRQKDRECERCEDVGQEDQINSEKQRVQTKTSDRQCGRRETKRVRKQYENRRKKEQLMDILNIYTLHPRMTLV